MSNRQARIARKTAQREGKEVFVHLKAQRRVLGRIPVVMDGSRIHPSNREVRRRNKRYGINEEKQVATDD